MYLALFIVRVRGSLRSVIVLEHPEVQDPDFETVLHTLFKLAAKLTDERRGELCGFLEGVEEQRFSRCGFFFR